MKGVDEKEYLAPGDKAYVYVTFKVKKLCQDQ